MPFFFFSISKLYSPSCGTSFLYRAFLEILNHLHHSILSFREKSSIKVKQSSVGVKLTITSFSNWLGDFSKFYNLPEPQALQL